MSSHLLAGLAGVVVGMVLYWLFLRLIDRVAEDFTVTAHQPECAAPFSKPKPAVAPVDGSPAAGAAQEAAQTRELAQRELGWDEPGDENIKI